MQELSCAVVSDGSSSGAANRGRYPVTATLQRRKHNGTTREWNRGPVPVQQHTGPARGGRTSDTSTILAPAVSKDMHALGGGSEVQKEGGGGGAAQSKDWRSGRMATQAKPVKLTANWASD